MVTARWRLFVATSLFAALVLGTCRAEEWHADLGIGASAVKIRNSATGSENDVRPDLQFGLFLLNGDNWRFGTSVEWLAEDLTQWSNSGNALLWRIADVDYRLSENIALNMHAGVARYYREQPSYGFNYGLGLKYRLSDSWYLAFDLTEADLDVSTGVPTDDEKSTKDDLTLASLRLHLIF